MKEVSISIVYQVKLYLIIHVGIILILVKDDISQMQGF